MMFGLPDATLELLQRYFESIAEIKEVRIYGSRALGTYRPGSDIDLAIYTTVQQDLSGKIKADLEELPTPYLFDVTDYLHIQHLPLKAHIDQVGKILYARG